MQTIAFLAGVVSLLLTSGPPQASASAGPHVVAVSPKAVATSPKPPLEKTMWTAIELEGQPVGPAKAGREARLVFDNGTLKGADGCSQVTGSYQSMGPAIRFGPLNGSGPQCSGGAATRRALQHVLATAHAFRVKEQELELFDGSGAVLARFAAPSVKGRTAAAATALAGTYWHLVRFQGSDGSTLTASGPPSYVLDFRADGSLFAAIGCHRAQGRWVASGRSDLRIAAAMTANGGSCASGRLEEHLVKNFGRVHSFTIKGGNLFLALMEDTGVYEYTPVKAAAKPQPQHSTRR